MDTCKYKLHTFSHNELVDKESMEVIDLSDPNEDISGFILREIVEGRVEVRPVYARCYPVTEALDYALNIADPKVTGSISQHSYRVMAELVCSISDATHEEAREFVDTFLMYRCVYVNKPTQI